MMTDKSRSAHPVLAKGAERDCPVRWHALVALYPPSWRARYGEEMRALLADSAHTGANSSVRTAASLLGGAAGAWLRPGRQLHTPASRLRASLSVLLVAWVTLAAAALIFGQLNDDQATQTVTPGHPITRQLFTGYTAAAHVSVGVLLACCAPLFRQLLLAGLHGRDRRALALLAAPAVIPMLFIAALATVSRLVGHPHVGVGAGWFSILATVGVLSGFGAVSGPLVALRRFRATGRAVRLALYGAGAAVVIMGAAVGASIADLITVREWGIAGFEHAPVPVIAGYGVLVSVVLTVAMTSGARGLAAARTR